MEAPVVRAVGAKLEAEAEEKEVGAPAGIATGDLEILIATTIAGGSVTIKNNGGEPWTAMAGSPQDVTGGEKLYIWYRIRKAGDGNPKVQAGSDHICAGRIAIKTGTFDPAKVFDGVVVATEATSDTSFAFFTFQETEIDACLCFIVCSSGVDSTTGQAGANTANANLANVNTTPLMEYNTNKGGGGGFWVSHGEKTIKGAVGEWTQTMVSATPKAYFAFSVRPLPPTPTEIPLGASSGVASATLALHAPTQVPLGASSGVASATLALHAPTQVPLAASSGVASATLALTAPTRIPLGAASGIASATLALTATTTIPLGASSGIATATLAIIQPPQRIPLQPSSGVATTSLTLRAPTTIPLDPSSGVSTTSLSLNAPTAIPLGASSGVGSATLGLVVARKINLSDSTGSASATLKLHAGPRIALGPSSGVASATLKVTYPIPASYKVRREGAWIPL